MNLEGKQDRSLAYVKDEEYVLLRSVNSSANDESGVSTLSSTESHRNSIRVSLETFTSSPRICH